MNSILFDFGIIQIKWYSFLIMIGIIIAYFLVTREAKKKGFEKEKVIDILFYTILIGMLGARIYYVLFNLEYYGTNPLEIFKVWNGGLAIHGGIITAFIFLYFYSKKKNYNLFLLVDMMVPGLMIAQAIGRWGNFFNQEAFGRAVSKIFLQGLHLPKFIIEGMYINGLYREPTFLYESLWNIIGFILILIIRKNKKIKTGMITGFYFIWYGIGRCIIESSRADSLMLGSLKIAQLVSILGIILGIAIIIISNKKKFLYIEDKVEK